jgi:hypothetical protein
MRMIPDLSSQVFSPRRRGEGARRADEGLGERIDGTMTRNRRQSIFQISVLRR